MSIASYSAGMRAAAAGQPVTDCPAGMSAADRQDWRDGHADMTARPDDSRPAALPPRPGAHQLDRSAIAPVVLPTNYGTRGWD